MTQKTIQKKSAHPKKQKVRKPAETEAGDEDAVIAANPLKAKKPVELDVVEAVIGIDEKIDPEAPIVEEGAEETAAEELGIDDDEIDPFGDKWEQ